MTTFTLADLADASDVDLGASEWRLVDQERVDLFADATDDHQWIHVDPERAAAGPFGGTVAHGYLTLSLLPSMLAEVFTVSDSTVGVNYGTDKIRFPAPVPVGSRIRLRARLASTEARAIGALCHVDVTIEVEGQEKPAVVGEVLLLSG
jgi:acyl dehydratase